MQTSSNQFGFKPKHSTDMSVFLYKQTVSSNVNQNTLVFSAFIDATKAFDKINYQMLFKKLVLRGVPTYFVRLLWYWYKSQSMQVSWGGQMSSSFSVFNGVPQGGVLSPFLFSVYIDDLSRLLNNVRAGCYVGNSCINHIFFADDICLMSPSSAGLQDLINVCSAYAKVNDIVFNCNKSYAMLYAPRYFSLSCMPVLRLGSDATIFFFFFLYSPYYAEACNELRGPFPQLSAWATQLRRNVATVASRWRHCVDLTGPGIEPQTSRTDSVRFATELTAGLMMLPSVL